MSAYTSLYENHRRHCQGPGPFVPQPFSAVGSFGVAAV